MPRERFGMCELCEREELSLSFHHLIPRSNHRNKWFRKRFELEDMRTRGLMLCRDCHRQIHRTYGEKELGREFNTLEKLQADAKIMRFVNWLKKRA